MWNCTKKFTFPIKLLKIGFVANDKWRQAPDFDLLHHIFRQGEKKRKKCYRVDT